MALRGENRTYPAYSQLRQIPGGGNSQIHLARHVGYDLPCLQKTYERPGREDALAFAEPRLLHGLDHPHIAKILDTQPDGDREHAVTVVMPLYPGGDLRQLIERGGGVSVGTAVEWGSQIADALDYLHRQSLAHRDVKPGNVLLDGQDEAVLCDFGTAARLDASGRTGPVRATLPYQPPETAGKGFMSGASDVYSLGLTLIELLDGRFLYGPVDAAVLQSRVDSGRRGYTDAALASSAREPHVPAVLRALLGRSVALDPSDRPTAGALARLLAALKTVDWRRTAGDGLDGEWHGTWPPRARPDRTVELSVTSAVRQRGRDAGRRELVGRYRKSANAGWRSIGSALSPAVVGAQDAAAVSRFFKTVADSAAQRFPA